MKQTQAYWDGRRDEVVASYKRDRLDLIRALDMDIVFLSQVPPADYHPEPLERLDSETYRNESGDQIIADAILKAEDVEEAHRINMAAHRAILRMCHEGYICGLFPSGTRIRPGDAATARAAGRAWRTVHRSGPRLR